MAVLVTDKRWQVQNVLIFSEMPVTNAKVESLNGDIATIDANIATNICHHRQIQKISWGKIQNRKSQKSWSASWFLLATQLLLGISILPQDKHICKTESKKNVPQLLSFTRKSWLCLPPLSGWHSCWSSPSPQQPCVIGQLESFTCEFCSLENRQILGFPWKWDYLFGNSITHFIPHTFQTNNHSLITSQTGPHQPDMCRNY